MSDIREVVADGRCGWGIVSFSDTLPLGEKRSCTKFAGLPHFMRLTSSLSAGVFQRSEANTIHPPAAYVAAPPDVASLSGDFWRGGLNEGSPQNFADPGERSDIVRC